MLDHPFFEYIDCFDNRPAVRSLLNRKIKILDDQISRCNELAEQTNVLISLIFNIATLQDTKAAVEESRAANTLASNIRRVTMLTFIYLPLTLASVSQRSPALSMKLTLDVEHIRHEHYPDYWCAKRFPSLGILHPRNYAHVRNIRRLVHLVAAAHQNRPTRTEDRWLFANSLKSASASVTILCIRQSCASHHSHCIKKNPRASTVATSP